MSRVPAFVRAFPRKLISRLMGHIGRLNAPSFVLQPILKIYVKTFGVNLDEMREPLSSYRSFLAFFTRPLKEGARPIEGDAQVLVSPADGAVQWCGAIEDGCLLQVKGIRYSVADLLADTEDARAFEGGQALVAYLSPGDYHRFHWPFDGAAEEARHVPGDLWPVNEKATHGVPGLFARNERVVVRGSLTSGRPFAYIPVGALNVGSIRMWGMPLRTNSGPYPPVRQVVPSDPAVVRGAECGCFEFGSSIALLLGPGAGTFDALAPGDKLVVGRRIGTLTAAGQENAVTGTEA